MIEKAANIQTLEGSRGTTVQNLDGSTEPRRAYRTDGFVTASRRSREEMKGGASSDRASPGTEGQVRGQGCEVVTTRMEGGGGRG